MTNHIGWGDRFRTLVVLVTCGAHVVVSGATAQTREPGSRVDIFQAVSGGLSSHPKLAVVRAGQAQAGAERRIARASWFPTLSMEGSAVAFQEPMIVAPLHGFDPTTPPVFARGLFQSQWLAGYTLFDGGVRGADNARTSATAQQADDATRAAELEVIEAVSTSYINAVTSREILAAEDRRLTSLEGERDRAQQLFDAGRVAQIDLLRADAALANARASRVVVQQELETSLHELSRLTRISLQALNPETLAGVMAIDTLALQVEELIADAQGTNPEIAAARHAVDAQLALARGARALWLPTVQASAGIRTFGGSGAGFTGEWQGGLTVSFPIFTGGRRSGLIARAQAAADGATAVLEQQQLQLSISIDRLVARINESRARADALERAVAYAVEVARIEQLSLSAGAGVQTDFLSAEAELFSARAELERTRNTELAALIALARMTGKLSIEWLMEHVETVQ